MILGISWQIPNTCVFLSIYSSTPENSAISLYAITTHYKSNHIIIPIQHFKANIFYNIKISSQITWRPKPITRIYCALSAIISQSDYLGPTSHSSEPHSSSGLFLDALSAFHRLLAIFQFYSATLPFLWITITKV